MKSETDCFYGLISTGLFEQGYLTVTPEYTLDVSDRLRHDYHNGRSYYPLRGSPISIPAARDRASDSRFPRLAQSERLFAIERVMEFATASS